jgi:hypothetical protein
VAIADPDLVAEVDVVVGQIRRIRIAAGCVSRVEALLLFGLKNDHAYAAGRDVDFAEYAGHRFVPQHRLERQDRAEVAAVEPERRLTVAELVGALRGPR